MTIKVYEICDKMSGYAIYTTTSIENYSNFKRNLKKFKCEGSTYRFNQLYIVKKRKINVN